MDKYFSSQQDDEQVIMVLRKHWFELIPSIVMSGFLYLLGFAGIFVLPFVLDIKGPLYNIYVIILSLLFLYTTAYLFSAWLIYYLNVGIITTEHIVEIVQISLFSRKISELGLDRIQDVSASQHGVSATMFNYGDIDIQTAGELPNFLFHNVPSPNENAQKIMELEEEYSKRHGIRSTTSGGNANVINHNIQSDQQVENNLEKEPEIEYPDHLEQNFQ